MWVKALYVSIHSLLYCAKLCYGSRSTLLLLFIYIYIYIYIYTAVSLNYFSENCLCICSISHKWSTALDCLHRERSAQTAPANFVVVLFYRLKPFMFSVMILNTRVLPQEMAVMNVELTAEWKIESVSRTYFISDGRISNIKAVCCCLWIIILQDTVMSM